MLALPASAQHGKPKPKPAPALLLAPLTGQPIPVLPITYVVADSGVPGLPATRTEQLSWIDSVFDSDLMAHGPEATWLPPSELRRVSRRAPEFVKDPSQMSQAVMRFDNLKVVPDPLLANLRMLVALTNSRFVMIPAAMRFSRDSAGVSLEAVLVVADARSGAIAWRSFPVVAAPTAAAAIDGVVARVLPDAQ